MSKYLLFRLENCEISDVLPKRRLKYLGISVYTRSSGVRELSLAVMLRRSGECGGKIAEAASSCGPGGRFTGKRSKNDREAQAFVEYSPASGARFCKSYSEWKRNTMCGL